MSDIVETIASQTGIDVDTIKKSVGAVLTFVKEHIGADTFEKLQAALPNADSLVSAFGSAEGSSGGIMGALSGLASKVLGGGGADASKLLEMLSKAGLSVDQVQGFVTKLIEQIRAHLPADVIDKIMAALPGVAGHSSLSE